MNQPHPRAIEHTLQKTQAWLSEIKQALGPGDDNAWHVLGAVLRAVRDRVPVDLAAHLGAELPTLVRGHYYDQWRPNQGPDPYRTLDEFLQSVQAKLDPIRTIQPLEASQAVFAVLSRHVDEGQVWKVWKALPEDVRDLWPLASS